MLKKLLREMPILKVSLLIIKTKEAKLKDKDNDLTNFYIDADSYLLVKQKDKIKVDTKEITAESILSNYKQVNGVLFPYSIESKSADNPMGNAKIVVDSIEINMTVDDSIFKMPATK